MTWLTAIYFSVWFGVAFLTGYFTYNNPPEILLGIVGLVVGLAGLDAVLKREARRAAR